MNRLRSWVPRPLGLTVLLLVSIWCCYWWTAQAMELAPGDSTALAAIVIVMTVISYCIAFHHGWYCTGALARSFLLPRCVAVTEEVGRISQELTAQIALSRDLDQRLRAVVDGQAAPRETLEGLKAYGEAQLHIAARLIDRFRRIERRGKRLGKAANIVTVMLDPPSQVILRRLGLRTQDANTVLTSLALLLAGPRHAHLRDAWRADLAGAPEDGITVTPRQARALVLGFVVAGLKLRVRSLARPLWAPVDWILKSKRRTSWAVAVGVGAMVIYCEVTGGVHGLLVDGMGSGALLYGGLHTLARALRRHRSIELDAPNGNRTTSSSDS